MAQYDGSILIDTGIHTKNASAQLMALENRIVKTADKIASLRAKMDSLKDTKMPTQEYQEIANQIEKAEEEFNKLLEKQAQMQREGKDNGVAWERLNAKTEEVGNTIRYAKGELQDLVDSGKAFTLGNDTQEYANLGQQLQYAENDLAVLNQRHNELTENQENVVSGYKKIGQIAKSAFASAGSAVKKVAVSSFNLLTKAIKKATSAMFGFGKSAKSSGGMLNGGLKNILKYGLGIRSLYVLVSRLRSGIKEGFSNLYNDKGIKGFKDKVDGLKASVLTLKNSFAAAFRPLVEVAIPYIQMVANAMSNLLNKVGQFMAAITGQKNYTKAVKQTASALNKQNKEQNKQLSNLDKLNNLTSEKKDSDKDSDTTGMFKEEKVPSAYVNLAKNLKEMWEKADFTELGKTIGKKLKAGLESIPWNKIKKTAEKIGKSLATLINGFVEVPGLGTTIGKTIAEAINTGLTGLNAFSKNLKWKNVGKFFADGINGFFSTFDFKLAADAINNTANGILDAFISCVKNVKWDVIRNKIKTFIQNLDFLGVSFRIGNLANALANAFYTMVSDPELFKEAGKKIADSINGFFKGMGEVDKKTGLTGWQALGKSISDSIKGIASTINTALETVDWDEVGKAIAQFIISIDWFGIIASVGKVIVNALFSAIKVAISALKEDPLGVSKAIVTVLGAYFAYQSLSSLISPLKGNIGTILSTAIRQSSIVSAAASLASRLKTTLVSAIASSNIGIAIGNAITGIKAGVTAIATKISTALSAAFSSAAFVTTLAAALGAAVAAAIAGAMIADRINEAIDAINFTGDYELKVPEKMKENAEKAKEALSKTQEEAKKVSETINGINESIKTTDGKNIDELAGKYYKLSQKTNPTASDIAVLKKYSKELSNAIPGFAKNVDKQTGAFKGSKKELNSLVKTTQRAAKAQAVYNSAVELYEKQQENKKSIEEKQKLVEKYEKEFEAVKKVTEAVKEQHGTESEVYKAQLRTLGTYASKVNSARAEVNTLKISQKEINEQIKKNNNIMETADVKYENITDKAKNLKTSLDKLNVSSKNQNTAVKTLKESLENGEISWKEYKKLCDGSYESTEAFYESLEKVAGKEVAAKIKAEISGSEKVDKFVDTLDGTKDKKVKVTAETKGDKKIKEMHDDIEKTKSKNITVTANVKFEKIKEAAQKAFKLAGKIVLSLVGAGGAKIPGLANGSVIRGGKPFLAMLGDQRRGQTNIEAPLPTITKAMMDALSNFDPPAYATGQVIPRTMKQHLALLGDNTKETEVVSPISVIEKAVGDALEKYSGSSGVIEIHVHTEIDGREIGKTVQRVSREHLRKTGNPLIAF